MHIIQEEIGLPKIQVFSESETAGVFIMEPLPQGYGMTIGNGLRRVLLSSLPGTAVVAVRVEGVTHEYSTVPGMKDSVLDFILNLKGVQFKKTSKGRQKITLEKKGSGAVLASDITLTGDLEVLNPDFVITELAAKTSHLKVEIIVEKNVGYSPARKRLHDEDLSEFIQVDALFSPIEKVRYNVEATRVGENTDLDKLTFEIETNGAISAFDSLKFSANILKSYFSLYDATEERVEAEFMTDINKAVKEDNKEEQREVYTPIEILNFSPRTLNSLINGDIGSVEQLQKCTPSKLQSLRGFGKKAMEEVMAALQDRGLDLLPDNQ